MSLSIGQTLQGKYVVKKQLGKGGFGLTYLAEHKYLSQDCVLKVPNKELQQDPEYPKFVKKFLQEGQKLAKLATQRHPHIVRVTDLFEEHSLPCLVMDFIAGESLLERVARKGALPEAEVVGFILQMADALAVVHREGLVHRDCHPGNIMILPPERHQPQRQAILIDFGIAGEMFPTTVSSKFFGNPAFAPYEQFGMPAAPSMDVYTLAASCYGALTGQYPATGLDRKLYGKDLISPIKHRPSLTPALNQVIINGMALEAKDRPDLAAWVNQLQQAIAPPPVTPTVRVVRPEPQGNWLENLIGLNKQPTPQNIPIQPVQPKSPAPSPQNSLMLDCGNGIKIELVKIPAGSFMMGSNDYESEKPIHRVNVKEFLMAKYQVTQAQYEAVMGENPSFFKGKQNPVEQVSWQDAQEFCQKLSQKTGRKINLPSEAQWEYACRAGSTGKYCFGDNVDQLGKYAWYYENSDSKTHPVGEKLANAWGLHDMHGNVWEWCEDVWHENYNGAPVDGSAWLSGGETNSKILRGGSWNHLGQYCRSANRNRSNLGYWFNIIGFRFVSFSDSSPL